MPDNILLIIMEACLNDIIARHWLDLYTYRADPLRVCAILTQTPYWLYIDIAKGAYGTGDLERDEFCFNIFKRCDFLRQYIPDFKRMYKDFDQYQRLIPTCGAVLLNKEMDKVALVTHFEKKGRGFPKGKINQGETEIECAVREVYEEVGIDVAGKINEKEYLLIEGIDARYSKLFVIAGFDDNIQLKPTAYKEIKLAQFYSIHPIKRNRWNKKNFVSQVSQLIGPLVKWIKKKKANRNFI